MIQNAQNRESKAIHLKLDELILGVNHARNELVDTELLTDEQLESLAARYHKVAKLHQHKLTERFPDDGCTEVIDLRGEVVGAMVTVASLRTNASRLRRGSARDSPLGQSMTQGANQAIELIKDK